MSDSSARPAAGPKLPPYGLSITNEQAKKVADAALAPARANGWTVVVAIVDTGGFLVYLEKLDQTQVGSVAIAEDKARASAIFKRPTKMFHERLARGGDGMIVLGLRGATPVEGGLPIVVDGKLIGALGVSGAPSSDDDHAIGTAAAAEATG